MIKDTYLIKIFYFKKYFLLYFVTGEPILGWYHYEPLQGMVKEPKAVKSFV